MHLLSLSLALRKTSVRVLCLKMCKRVTQCSRPPWQPAWFQKCAESDVAPRTLRTIHLTSATARRASCKLSDSFSMEYSILLNPNSLAGTPSSWQCFHLQATSGTSRYHAPTLVRSCAAEAWSLLPLHHGVRGGEDRDRR